MFRAVFVLRIENQPQPEGVSLKKQKPRKTEHHFQADFIFVFIIYLDKIYKNLISIVMKILNFIPRDK